MSDDAKSFLKKPSHDLFIDNEWKPSTSDDSIAIVNPASEGIIATVCNGSIEDVDSAVVAARNAFDDSAWRKMNPSERASILYKFSDLLEEHCATIAEILTVENGKLINQSKSEVMSAASTFRYYAGWATKIEGETIDISLKQAPGKKNFAFTRREPLGVVAAIVPWNFPISIASWKLAPLLAAGCTCVLKPSEVSPLSSLFMAQLFTLAGFPKGVINVITGDGNTGAALTSHKGIDKITFTGSSHVGKMIGKSAMENLTDISLELGGKSPVLVFDDADLKDAVKSISMGIFRNGGQVCVAGSRAYVQESILEEFLEKIKAFISTMNISDGFDTSSELGPLVSESHLIRVCQYVETGKKELKVIHGGKRLERKGYYFEPTIFLGKDNDSTLVSEEVFGPVLVVIPFKDKSDAIRLANDSDFALSSTVWTKDIDKAMECIESLNAGWVFVNSVARSDPHFPIGGYKQSGVGKELGKVGLYAYTKVKSVNIVYG